MAPRIQLVNRRHLADRLGISERTVCRLVASDTIPCVRIGRSVRFNVPEVLAALEDAERKPADVA